MNVAFFKLEKAERKKIKENKALRKLGVNPIFINGPLNDKHIPTQKNLGIVCIFVGSKITKKVLSQLPNLKFIATRSTGYDHIDMKEIRKRGIVVSNVPQYGEETVAEFTFALILTLSRKIYSAYDRIRETGSFDLTGLRGFDLKGKTIGVVGTGAIGRNVIQIAVGFEMNILATDINEDKAYAKKMGFTYVSLERLLKNSDIVTLHVPYFEATHHLINKKTLGMMKSTAYLVNTSRGAVVETQALVAALQKGEITGAALDVLEEEGVIKDEIGLLTEGHPRESSLRTLLANHVLIDMDNVIITPHNAFNTQGALDRILDTTIENIIAFCKGKPINTVNDN